MSNSKNAATANPIIAFDRNIRKAVVPYQHSPAVKIIGWMSDVGDQPQMRILTGAVMVAGIARGDLRMIRAGVRMLIAHELATTAKGFVKKRIDRTRPRSASSSADQVPQAGHSHAKEETSFPSGHSTGAMAVARAFAREYPSAQTWATGLAGLVAVAQIPRCAHYPSDVVAGAALGAAIEALAQKVERAVTTRALAPPEPVGRGS